MQTNTLATANTIRRLHQEMMDGVSQEIRDAAKAEYLALVTRLRSWLK